VRPSDEDRDALELLGLSPGASIDEIRRAYQQLARTLAPGSLTLYSVLEPHEQHDLQRRLHAAYRHLLQRAGGGEVAESQPGPPLGSARPSAGETRPRRRPAREVAAPPAAPPPPSDTAPAPALPPPAEATPLPDTAQPDTAPADATSPETAPPPTVAAAPPESGPAPVADEEFGGAALRARREAAGITLADLSRRTRIRGAMIESVEAEAYGELPPRVYLRGFVLALARELKLDGEKVWRDYERRWQAATVGGTTPRGPGSAV
jgi:hypothetical protein